jgi:hypothetical protein
VCALQSPAATADRPAARMTSACMVVMCDITRVRGEPYA